MMKWLLFIIFPVIFLVSFVLYQQITLNDGKFRIVFCNVGQGDAVLIRSPTGKVILFDGGPDTSVLSCLNDHLPLWQRTVDVMMLSHPHADHLNGFIDVLARYRVKAFATEKLSNPTSGYKALEEAIARERISRSFLYKNSVIQTPDGLTIRVLSPTQKYLENTSTQGVIKEAGEFASLIVVVSYKDFDVLLTGDTQALQLSEATREKLPRIDVLQVPHHGSRTGLTEDIIKTLEPKVAVISVGKNKYGHPSPFILNLLSRGGIAIERTDKRGQIVIVSNGSSYSIE